MALDNEAAFLMNSGFLEEASHLLQHRLKDVCREEGFAASKAVTYSSLLHLSLRRREWAKAEAYFFEAILQCMYQRRWRGIADNLRLLLAVGVRESQAKQKTRHQLPALGKIQRVYELFATEHNMLDHGQVFAPQLRVQLKQGRED
jgi:hypothetical protein